MVVKTIHMLNHRIDRYGKIKETYLKDNQNRFDEALDTTISIGKYFKELMTSSCAEILAISHTQRLR